MPESGNRRCCTGTHQVNCVLFMMRTVVDVLDFEEKMFLDVYKNQESLVR